MQHGTHLKCGQRYTASPLAMFVSLGEHRSLILQLTRRTVAGRYKGSLIGGGWFLITPLLLLGIYTFVFGIVFSVRWGERPENGMGGFAIFIFSGLMVHALLAECINNAPRLIINNVNYVKKMVFPIEVLAWVTVATALFHLTVSLLVLIGAQVLISHTLPWTVILFPILVAPLVLIAVGFTWLLAAFGVFLRDVSQITGLVVTALLFLAPVFYPLSRLPETYQHWLYLNPLTFVIEQGRRVLLLGEQPDWAGLGLYTLVAITIAQVGFWWFQRTRRGFADVL